MNLTPSEQDTTEGRSRETASRRASALIACALGTALAGVNSREARLVREAVVGTASAGPCHLLGGGLGSPGAAALWNGFLIHCADYDDTHQASVTHPSSSVLPAALVGAELAAGSVGLLLDAYARGAETVIRLAAAAPGRFHERGFHATAVCGSVGAAVAYATARGYDERIVQRAAAIAATWGGGTFEYIRTGGNTKTLYPGLASRWGIEATELARVGMEPPAAAIDGEFGLMAVHTGLRRSVPLPPRDGPHNEFQQTAIKSYPCCYFSQVFLDCVASIRPKIRQPDDVVAVWCEGPTAMLEPIFEPRARRVRPSDAYEAKFALPFQIAAMLRQGAVGLATFDEAMLGDEALARLAEKVEPRESVVPYEYPHSMPGRVVVRRADGRDVELSLPGSVGATWCDLDAPFVRDRLSRDLGKTMADRLSLLLADRTRAVVELVSLLGSFKAPVENV